MRTIYCLEYINLGFSKIPMKSISNKKIYKAIYVIQYLRVHVLFKLNLL